LNVTSKQKVCFDDTPLYVFSTFGLASTQRIP